MKETPSQFPTPPEASLVLRRMKERITAPVERFLHTETAGGFLLLGAALAALIWANSPWASSYEHLWHETFTLGFGDWTFTRSLHFWVNEFLMTFFFMVAGFEIKREIAEGELSDLRRAALPIGAAIGGMLVPAGLYFAFNTSGPTQAGWGIPMATDIAFALGMLSLLGRRVPAALRILLLALAIIDDLGAILVIAIFYSSDISMTGFAIAGVGAVVLYVFHRSGLRPGFIFFIPLIIMWAGLYEAGVHPTIAGVIVGMSAPVRPWLSREHFIAIAERSLGEYQRQTANTFDHHDVIEPLRRLSVAGREAVSPVVRLEQTFHPWVAFVIMPLFALANAGVPLEGMDMGQAGAPGVMIGIILGLALGKPLGVVLVTWIMVRLNLCKLPRGVTWTGLTVLGLMAGIGFTMSIFIAELAFRGSPTLGVAKLGVLVATGIATVVGLLLGRFALKADASVAGVTAQDAEQSTEY